MATSNAVRGAGLLTNVWKKLETAVYDAGGTDEHLERLGKADGDPLIAEFARNIVAKIKIVYRLSGNHASFAIAIAAGKYDYKYGFAENPDQIRGQAIHVINSEVELDHPAETLTAQQVFDRYGSKMASLAELLQFAIQNPGIQCQFPIGIVWKDETGQFWYAILSSGGSDRKLDVDRGRPVAPRDDNYRFLLRK